MHTEADCAAALDSLHAENAHLDPCCLLLQAMAPGEAVALSLFVTKGAARYSTHAAGS